MFDLYLCDVFLGLKVNCFVSTHHQLRHRREIGLDHNVIQSESSRRKEDATFLNGEDVSCVTLYYPIISSKLEKLT